MPFGIHEKRGIELLDLFLPLKGVWSWEMDFIVNETFFFFVPWGQVWAAQRISNSHVGGGGVCQESH